MKNRIFLALASSLALVSCVELSQDVTIDISGPSSMVFDATIETMPETRTTISDYDSENNCYSLLWEKGDAISIYDGMETAVYQTESADSKTAEFIYKEGSLDKTAARYEAFYPSTLTHSNMVLPAVQQYVENDVDGFPMRAVSYDKELSFKNLCGIIRLSLTSAEDNLLSVSSISLSSDKGMSGEFTVGDDDAAVVAGNDGVIMECKQAKLLYSEKASDFNISVPQGDYNPLCVKIISEDGKELNLKSDGPVSVKRSEMTRIKIKLAKESFDSSLETIPIKDSDVEFSQR